MTKFPIGISSTGHTHLLALAYLRGFNSSLRPALQRLNQTVLDDGCFLDWPASVKHHHCYSGGLLRHTVEVVSGCFDQYQETVRNGKPLDWSVLFTAALWHDYGKLWDYEKNPEWTPEAVAAPGAAPKLDTKGEPIRFWRETSHRREIRHLSRSYAEFMIAANRADWGWGEEQSFIQAVSHCILSHHGRQDWGSPVEPTTREAWALHLADMSSTRVISDDHRDH